VFIITKIKQKQKWDNDEDKRLLQIAEQYKEKNWKKISEFFNKSPIQCYSRYKRIRKGLIKGRWTPLEDRLILDFVSKYGKNWSFISKQMTTRTGKQIRDRYLNCLDPLVKRLKFSEEEDHKIISLYCTFGPKWSDIAKFCHGRTADMIKNRFYSKIKRQIHLMNNKKQLMEFNKETLQKMFEKEEKMKFDEYEVITAAQTNEENDKIRHNNSGFYENDDADMKNYCSNFSKMDFTRSGPKHDLFGGLSNEDCKFFDPCEKDENCDIVSYYNTNIAKDVFDEFFTYDIDNY